jgi:tRNA A37 methylthiotransferase MiaB
VNERSEKMSEIVRKISFEKNKEWIDWEGVVLVSKRGKEAGQWLGRNPAYKLVLIENKENLLGKFVKVRIKEAGYSHLMGVLI